MYYYIVDAKGLTQRAYERVQNDLYSSLSNYKVSGEVVRITGVRPIGQLVETAIMRQASTIVAVGTDETFNELISSVLDKDIVTGFIPTKDSELGRVLGIKTIEQGAKTIASRRVEHLDLGKINDSYFITKLGFGLMKQKGFWKNLDSIARTQEVNIEFSVDGKFQASALAIGGMVLNSRGGTDANQTLGNPLDGMFDMLLLPKLTTYQVFKYRRSIAAGSYEDIPGCSIVHANRIEILGPSGLSLMADDKPMGKTPAIIQVMPQTLKIIVGRERKF